MVQQHCEMAEFNTSSVNTLRIVTMLCPDNTVIIPAAFLRMGRKGRCVDNFHFYGIAAAIDIETGIVKTTGVDKNLRKICQTPGFGKDYCRLQNSVLG